MQRSVSLPQFKDERIKCGPRCGIRHKCRHPAYADWREAQTGMREFACPFGLPVGGKPGDDVVSAPPQPNPKMRGLGDVVAAVTDAVGIKSLETRQPAEMSLTNIASFIRTWTTGEMVSDEIANHRKAICAECEYRKESDAGFYCGSKSGCGCTVEPRKTAFLTIGMADITLYAEKKGKPLCAHPKRKEGKGWPL